MTNIVNHTIDATGKKLGRIASKAAALLIGKDLATFQKNVVQPVIVSITNASKASVSDKKMSEKQYVTYSGFPGGLYTESMKNVTDKKGIAEAFRLAVYGKIGRAHV